MASRRRSQGHAHYPARLPRPGSKVRAAAPQDPRDWNRGEHARQREKRRRRDPEGRGRRAHRAGGGRRGSAVRRLRVKGRRTSGARLAVPITYVT